MFSSCRANENILDYCEYETSMQDIKNKQANIENSVKEACEQLLDALMIQRDHNTKNTAQRMAKMFVREVFRGRYEPMPVITTFPNYNNIDQFYTVGPVTIRSCCSHHFVPIIGQAWFGVLPTPECRMLGLSKFARLADWVFRRPQIQEEATDQLGKLLCSLLEATAGFGLVVKAKHFCTVWRGVEEYEQTMITSYLQGKLRIDQKAKQEFFDLIKAQGF